MNIVNSIATRNPCYKAGKSIKVDGIMLEGVGCPQPSAKVFAHNRNRENCEGKCAHAFIDANDGNVIQILPWSHRGWHCGKHPRTKMNANNTHIGLQLCEPSQIRYKKRNEIELVGDKDRALAAVQRVYKSTVELCAKLCKDFNLDPMKAIVSRKEGYEAGICSMQASPEFIWDVVGATYEMDTLRADVQIAMTEEASIVDVISELKEFEKVANGFKEGIASTESLPLIEEEPINIEEAPTFEEKSEIKMVKVTVDNLRIRSTPGLGNNTTGKFTGRGTFAITEIQNGNGSKAGWGKLQNGTGWICLDYVEIL